MDILDDMLSKTSSKRNTYTSSSQSKMEAVRINKSNTFLSLDSPDDRSSLSSIELSPEKFNRNGRGGNLVIQRENKPNDLPSTLTSSRRHIDGTNASSSPISSRRREKVKGSLSHLRQSPESPVAFIPMLGEEGDDTSSYDFNLDHSSHNRSNLKDTSPPRGRKSPPRGGRRAGKKIPKPEIDEQWAESSFDSFVSIPGKRPAGSPTYSRDRVNSFDEDGLQDYQTPQSSAKVNIRKSALDYFEPVEKPTSKDKNNLQDSKGSRNLLKIDVGDDQDVDTSIEVTNLDSPEPLPVATKKLTVAKGNDKETKIYSPSNKNRDVEVAMSKDNNSPNSYITKKKSDKQQYSNTDKEEYNKNTLNKSKNTIKSIIREEKKEEEVVPHSTSQNNRRRTSSSFSDNDNDSDGSSDRIDVPFRNKLPVYSSPSRSDPLKLPTVTTLPLPLAQVGIEVVQGHISNANNNNTFQSILLDRAENNQSPDLFLEEEEADREMKKVPDSVAIEEVMGVTLPNPSILNTELKSISESPENAILTELIKDRTLMEGLEKGKGEEAAAVPAVVAVAAPDSISTITTAPIVVDQTQGGKNRNMSIPFINLLRRKSSKDMILQQQAVANAGGHPSNTNPVSTTSAQHDNATVPYASTGNNDSNNNIQVERNSLKRMSSWFSRKGSSGGAGAYGGDSSQKTDGTLSSPRDNIVDIPANIPLSAVEVAPVVVPEKNDTNVIDINTILADDNNPNSSPHIEKEYNQSSSTNSNSNSDIPFRSATKLTSSVPNSEETVKVNTVTPSPSDLPYDLKGIKPRGPPLPPPPTINPDHSDNPNIRNNIVGLQINTSNNNNSDIDKNVTNNNSIPGLSKSSPKSLFSSINSLVKRRSSSNIINPPLQNTSSQSSISSINQNSESNANTTSTTATNITTNSGNDKKPKASKIWKKISNMNSKKSQSFDDTNTNRLPKEEEDQHQAETDSMTQKKYNDNKNENISQPINVNAVVRNNSNTESNSLQSYLINEDRNSTGLRGLKFMTENKNDTTSNVNNMPSYNNNHTEPGDLRSDNNSKFKNSEVAIKIQNESNISDVENSNNHNDTNENTTIKGIAFQKKSNNNNNNYNVNNNKSTIENLSDNPAAFINNNTTTDCSFPQNSPLPNQELLDNLSDKQTSHQSTVNNIPSSSTNYSGTMVTSSTSSSDQMQRDDLITKRDLSSHPKSSNSINSNNNHNENSPNSYVVNNESNEADEFDFASGTTSTVTTDKLSTKKKSDEATLKSYPAHSQPINILLPVSGHTATSKTLPTTIATNTDTTTTPLIQEDNLRNVNINKKNKVLKPVPIATTTTSTDRMVQKSRSFSYLQKSISNPTTTTMIPIPRRKSSNTNILLSETADRPQLPQTSSTTTTSTGISPGAAMVLRKAKEKSLALEKQNNLLLSQNGFIKDMPMIKEVIYNPNKPNNKNNVLSLSSTIEDVTNIVTDLNPKNLEPLIINLSDLSSPERIWEYLYHYGDNALIMTNTTDKLAVREESGNIRPNNSTYKVETVDSTGPLTTTATTTTTNLSQSSFQYTTNVTTGSTTSSADNIITLKAASSSSLLLSNSLQTYFKVPKMSEFSIVNSIVFSGELEKLKKTSWEKRYVTLSIPPIAHTPMICGDMVGSLSIYSKSVMSAWGELPLQIRRIISNECIVSVETNSLQSKQGREFTVTYYSKLLRNGKETHGFNYTNSTPRIPITIASTLGPLQSLNRWQLPYNNNNHPPIVADRYIESVETKKVRKTVTFRAATSELRLHWTSRIESAINFVATSEML